MDRLQQFAAIEAALNTINTRVNRLAFIFSQNQARTAVDDGLIDELIVTAGALETAATALKTVQYDPQPDPDAPPA
jgi:hypothetical protein